MSYIKLAATWGSLPELREKFKAFPEKFAATALADALKKAIEPPFQRLKQTTPVGPTGNLRRAIAKKVVTYKQSGNAVALVGYTRAGSGKSSSAQGGSVRAGKDRAFHQGFLEFGTKPRVIAKQAGTPFKRTTKTGKEAWIARGQGGYIASSFYRLGPFQILSGKKGKTLSTSPAYPKAFFMKSGKPITIKGVTPGGVLGEGPPIRTALEQTRPQIESILREELLASFESAMKAIAYENVGTVSSGSVSAGG